MMKVKSQSTLEYALFIGVFVLSLVTMSFFLRAHLQGKVRKDSQQISTSLYIPGESTMMQNSTIVTTTLTSSDDAESRSSTFQTMQTGSTEVTNVK